MTPIPNAPTMTVLGVKVRAEKSVIGCDGCQFHTGPDGDDRPCQMALATAQRRRIPDCLKGYIYIRADEPAQPEQPT